MTQHKNKNSTEYSSRSKSGDANQYVSGVRVVGHRTVHWFRDCTDSRGHVIVGRTRQRPIRIRDKTVSRRHCEIQRVEPGSYFLRDLGSLNGIKVRTRGHYGTWVKVGRNEKIYLEPGMHIKLGNAIMVPVDADGLCPISAHNHRELSQMARETYGSCATARAIIGHSRRWACKMLGNLVKVLS